MSKPVGAVERLREIGEGVRQEFSGNKRLLTFGEYLALAEAQPSRHARSAAQYLFDVFEHYGSESVPSPAGEVQRFKLFDTPWDPSLPSLVGQEQVQQRIYRSLSRFVRQGRVDRLILLHGPNGSSKSTIIQTIIAAMEHYSAGEEGLLYRYNWVFPTRTTGSKDIGFHGDRRAAIDSANSYARLDESEIDARLPCEQRDHPLLLIPVERRQALLRDWLAADDSDVDDDFVLSDYILHGDLCHKCKEIYESLLSAYEGDYLRVMRHVQVERFYISGRYSLGTSRVEPQMAVDAHSRQVTADRSLGALPASLQNVALHEVGGELVDANRGVIDYADLLKRPHEAYKYLLTTVESGRVALDPANLFLDVVFIGSANERHLNAFMEVPEWTSFKARIELIRVPYLRRYDRERQIYEEQIHAQHADRHVSPHATAVAALWAILTRMYKPDLSLYDEEVKDLIGKLSPLEKADLYQGRMPPGTDEEAGKLLRKATSKLYGETDAKLIYEGRTGASPRELKAVLMDAAQDHDQELPCLTTDAVLRQLEKLVQETSVYAFLRQESEGNGFFEHRGFIGVCREWFLQRADEDVRAAMGLVDEASYAELFGRYVTHVTHFVRKEQLLNPVTGKFEDADQKMMAEVEEVLNIDGEAPVFREAIMTKIGAWSVDHPGERPNYATVFADHFTKLRQHYHDQQHERVGQLLRSALRVLNDETAQLEKTEVRAVEKMLTQMRGEAGYCERCATEAITMLARLRYAD